MSETANVLIVDDNCKYLKDALPFYGYDADLASDGIQALKLLTSDKNYDMVLLDVMMPKMDGWQTLKAIRNNDKIKNIPVIMLTAVSDEQKVISGLKTGADDYIIKPFVLPNLLARMEAVLRRVKRYQTDKPAANDDNIKLINTLTEREYEVLKMASKGESNKQIADKLYVKEVTVKTHLNNIFKKLKVQNRTQATLIALEMNI